MLDREQIFIAPNGREYKWIVDAETYEACSSDDRMYGLMKLTGEQLVQNDGTDTPVAHFHNYESRLIGKSRPASLEILPAGEHMVDLIVITLVYIENYRQLRDQNLNAPSAAVVLTHV